MKIASCGSPTDCHWHWLSSDRDCRVSFFTGETQRHCRQRRSLCHLWWRCRCLSVVNRGTHLRLHGTYQTSHGRPQAIARFWCRCFYRKTQIMPSNSEQFWTWSNTATLPTTVPGWVIGTDTVSVTAAVSHIVSVMEYLVHTVATLA